MEIDTIKTNVALGGEALSLIHSILIDLVKEASEDPTEYADDLDRLDQIANLLA